MELGPNEVYYNINIDKDNVLPYGCFYIGNGNIFLFGMTYSFHNNQENKNKILLHIKFINSLNKNNKNMIVSNSYETVEETFYDSIEDAINLKEMLRIWIKYMNHKCDKKFIKTASFKIIPDVNENHLNKIEYKKSTLVDTIIFNKKLKMEDMQYVPFSYDLREKINITYNQDIFDLNEFDNLINMIYNIYG